MSFQALNLPSTRISHDDYHSLQTRKDDNNADYGDEDGESSSICIRRSFGQVVLWCRYQNESEQLDEIGTTKNNSGSNAAASNNNNIGGDAAADNAAIMERTIGRHLVRADLEPYRQVGDPMVDSLLDAMHAAGTPLRPGQDLLTFCESSAAAAASNDNDDSRSTTTHTQQQEQLAAELWNYHHQQLPEWVDVAQLRRGQEAFLAYFTAFSMCLFYLALVPAFSISKVVPVLQATRYLTPSASSLSKQQQQQQGSDDSGGRHKVHERLLDTGAMLAACMASGIDGFLPGGVGWRSVLQVRVLHAKVRHALKRRKDWNLEQLGVPINHEDLALTLLLFSAKALLGIEFLLGFPLSRQEREDYLALWRYLGWLLGVPTASDAVGQQPVPLKPLDPCGPGWILSRPDPIAHSTAMLHSINFHILHPDSSSVAIAHHLLRAGAPDPLDNMRPTHATTREVSNNNDNIWFYFRTLLCRRFIGNPLADALELPLPECRWKRILLWMATTVTLWCVRLYTFLALPGSPLRYILLYWHERLIQQFLMTWQANHHGRSSKQSNTTKTTADANNTHHHTNNSHQPTTSIHGWGNDAFDRERLSKQAGCPFQMVAPPIY